MAHVPWRRTLQLVLQQQPRSSLPPLAARSRSSLVAPSSEELRSRAASWALSTREALISSRDHLSKGCTQVCGIRIGNNWGLANCRRSFHATGVQHMAPQNYYKTLRLQKGAIAKEIKSVYYQLANKWHPDLNKGNAYSRKKFQEIQQAYEVLKDDKKRALCGQVFGQRAAGGVPGGGRGGVKDAYVRFRNAHIRFRDAHVRFCSLWNKALPCARSKRNASSSAKTNVDLTLDSDHNSD